MKRIIALLMMAILMLSVCGCSSSESEEKKEKSIFQIAKENKAKRELTERFK